jgi:hypothetical protein
VAKEPGATADQFRVDQAKCRLVAAGLPPSFQVGPDPTLYGVGGLQGLGMQLQRSSDELGNAAMAMQAQRNCLEALGWSRSLRGTTWITERDEASKFDTEEDARGGLLKAKKGTVQSRSGHFPTEAIDIERQGRDWRGPF